MLVQSSPYIITLLGTKKKGVIIKNLYDVTIEEVFLIVLLVTWAKCKSAYKGGVIKQEVTIEGDDCICNIL